MRYAYTYLRNVDIDALEETLNEMGKAGWHMVYLAWVGTSFGWDIVMERRSDDA